MHDLFTPRDHLTEGYSRIYEALSKLREGFHRSGRIDDSNAKLDEVSKLLATYLAFKNHQIPKFPTAHSSSLVSGLQTAFAATARLPQYQLDGGASIFGAQPSLVIRPGDESLAADLVALVRDCVDLAFDLRAHGRPFDILNEAFGHFVRDNFRGNIEDAQYMTPPEVVDFMVDMALHEIATEDPAAHDPSKHWTILDPSCGVGSFLGAIYHRARGSDWLDPSRLRLYGQDKVERMVRLSTINLELFDVEEHRITIGNSLERNSPIDGLNGKVDLILTNPPFGARFDRGYVAAACGANTPCFSAMRRAPGMVDSELLFVDRDLQLLRDGGHLLIVVPDGVVSAKGAAAVLRQYLSRIATLRTVVEFPATAFAQAGTRTKTALLYLQKGRSAKAGGVFMGVSQDLGFQVSSRKGVQVKIPEGTNDLREVLAEYTDARRNRSNGDARVLKAKPSCVVIAESTVLKGSWTPNHYSAARFAAVAAVGKDTDIDLVPLRELVDFCAERRKAEAWREGRAFISVLHILGEGLRGCRQRLDLHPENAWHPYRAGRTADIPD